MKRLTRSNEKLVAGVISGISNYVNPELDPVFFRLAFAWITFFNPYLILIYLGNGAHITYRRGELFETISTVNIDIQGSDLSTRSDPCV